MGAKKIADEFVKAAQSEGTYASLPGVPLDKMQGGRDFATRYAAQFKQPIQLYAPYCYDAVNVMIAAIQQADSAEPAKYLPLLGKSIFDVPLISRNKICDNGRV